MQASPSGMASASQADFGGSDSRRLLQKTKPPLLWGLCFLTYRLSRRESGVGRHFAGAKRF